jgi:tetrahydrodipicolinate N-succinyltransferase
LRGQPAEADCVTDGGHPVSISKRVHIGVTITLGVTLGVTESVSIGIAIS